MAKIDTRTRAGRADIDKTVKKALTKTPQARGDIAAKVHMAPRVVSSALARLVRDNGARRDAHNPRRPTYTKA